MIYGLIIVWMTLRGIVEGMIFSQFSDPMYGGDPDKNEEGIRCHDWFRWYHWLCIARDGALIATVLLMLQSKLQLVAIAGVIIIGWELFEMAYNYTRFRRFVTEHENVMGAFDLNGWPVWLLHAGRWIGGAALIIAGICA